MAVVVLLVASAGCTRGAYRDSPFTVLTTLRPGTVVTAATSSGGTVLLGGHLDALPAPRASATSGDEGGAQLLGPARTPLLLRLPPGSGRAVRLRLLPSSYYGSRADVFALAVAGRRVAALGSAVGGSHGNPRFSWWSGDLAGVRDVPQPFELSGGESAGTLTDLAPDGRGGLVAVGSWDGPSGALGGAVWFSRDAGVTWTRDSSISVLESGAEEIVTPRSVAAWGSRALIGATAWDRRGSHAFLAVQTDQRSWRRIWLKDSAGATDVRVLCGHVCVAAAVTAAPLASSLLIWRLTGTAEARAVAPVKLAVPPGCRLPRSAVAVVPTAAVLVNCPDRARLVLLRDQAPSRTLALPPAVAVVGTGSALLVVTSDRAPRVLDESRVAAGQAAGRP